jgi:hypothetical protein
MRVSGSPGSTTQQPVCQPGATARATVAAPTNQWHSVNARMRHWQELQRCGKAYRHVLPTDALRPHDLGSGRRKAASVPSRSTGSKSAPGLARGLQRSAVVETMPAAALRHPGEMRVPNERAPRLVNYNEEQQ